MPRRRVRPEDRRRSSRACVPCKLSKKRCDAQLPCASCLRRDRALSCVYRAKGALPSSPLQLRTEVHVAERERNLNLNLEPTPDIPPTSPGNLSLENRVLISSKGEKVYCGKLASLSFLQFLRRTLKQQMGPSPFTESERRHSMLEADVSAHKSGGFTETLSEKQALTQVYFEATGALIDLFTRSEMNRLLAESETSPTGISSIARNRDDLAALYVAIAIGGQCRGSSSEDLQLATKYFAEAQRFAFEGMLKDPSLSMVRLFLLMAFYMLGACHRNAAFMYLGVASKAAEALGLHTPEYHRGMRNESDLSIRIWKSLRILDLLVSAILGRHSSLSAVRYDPAIPRDTIEGTRNPRTLAIDATFEACSILDEITQKLGKSENLDATASQSLLQKLQHWSQNLPNELRQFGRTDSTALVSTDKELLIENMHVACVYYFSVILVTRPFLISHLMLRLHNRTSDSLDSNTETANHQQMLELAHACVSSASYLIHMSHRALTLGLLLKNMCILKAWIFAAGLVLGFSLFPREEARHDIEDAFTKSRHILEVLAELSPQAKHYYEILSNFSEAIARYQQRIAYERQGTGSQYVSQILSIDVDVGGGGDGNGSRGPTGVDWSGDGGGTSEVSGLSLPGGNDTANAVAGNSAALSSTPAPDIAPQQQQQGRYEEPTSQQIVHDEPFPDAQLLWDDSSNQLLGSFPLDYETFGMLFEGAGGLASDLSL